MRFKVYLLLILSVASLGLRGQNISRQVFGAGGYTNNSFHAFVRLEYNIGESLVSTIGNNNNIITQGFIQPALPIPFLTLGNIKFGFKPNPASNFINIYTDSKITADIRIMDLNSRLIREYFDVELNYIFEFDVSDLIPGVYFILIKNNEETIVKKFIKQ